MSFVQIVLSGCVLGISLLGYFLLLKKSIGDILGDEFFPGLIIAFISVIMVFAGILNIMYYAAWAVLFVGLVYFAGSIIKHPKNIKGIISLTIFFVLLFAVVLTRMYHGALATHYDDFSHWLTVIKSMVLSDSLPSFKTNMVTFSAYPTGVASFIYYIMRFLVFRESIALILQGLMILCFILPLFSFVNRKSIISWVVIISAFIAIVSCFYVWGTLLVDDMLAAVGIYLVALVWKFVKTKSKDYWIIAILSVFTVLIKNSGFFFIVIPYIMYMVLNRRNNNKSNIIGVTSSALLVPAFAFWLWLRHVDLVFSAGTSSKHAVNVTSYFSSINKQSLTELVDRLHLILQRMLDLSNENVRQLFIAIVIMAVLSVAFRITKNNYSFRIVAFGVFYSIMVYVFWGISLWLMYSTSMHGGERNSLAGFDRYMSTAVILVYGILYIHLLLAVQNISFNLRSMTGAVATVAVVLTLWIPYTRLKPFQWKFTPKSISQVRRISSDLVRSNNLPNNSSYLVLAEGSADFLYYMYKYELWTTNVRTIDIRDIESIELARVDFDSIDYILIATPQGIGSKLKEQITAGGKAQNSQVIISTLIQ